MTKELKDLNLIDSFLFGTVMADEEPGHLLGKIILETLFERKFNKLMIRSEYPILPSTQEFRGIRLDAYIEENDVEVIPNKGGIYDIEPDTKKNEKKYLPERARFYRSRIDVKLVESGTKRIKNLKKIWVIFIVNFDPFDLNRMVYTIKNRCVEAPKMDYDDGATTLFLNAEGTEGEPPEKLRVLLNYLKETTRANAITPELSKIQDIVEGKKLDPEIKERYMDWEEYIERERDEVRTEAEQIILAEKQKAEAERQRADTMERSLKEKDEEIKRLKEQLANLGVK